MIATSLRVRIKERGQLPGRVSLRAASAIVKALQVALRAEAATTNIRKASQRGRLSKLARESMGIALVAIEGGSGVMVWESETASLLDLPSQVFEHFIGEARRESGHHENVGIQKAILSLSELFEYEPAIESVEFIDATENVGVIYASTIDRIRIALSQAPKGIAGAQRSQVTGRLLELDLVNRSLELHSVQERAVVEYDDFMEPIVISALNHFVRADVRREADGSRSLLSMNVIESVPDSRFDDVRSIAEIVGEQRVEPITDFSLLAMENLDLADTASLEEFQSFIRLTRRDEAC